MTAWPLAGALVFLGALVAVVAFRIRSDDFDDREPARTQSALTQPALIQPAPPQPAPTQPAPTHPLSPPTE
jgi:hypothetical protein